MALLLLLVAAFALLVTGVALLSVPAALIVAGVALGAFALLVDPDNVGRSRR